MDNLDVVQLLNDAHDEMSRVLESSKEAGLQDLCTQALKTITLIREAKQILEFKNAG